LHYTCTYYMYTVMQANIINDLLDFETLKGTAAAPELSRVDVDAVVHSVVRMFTTSVRSKVMDSLWCLPNGHLSCCELTYCAMSAAVAAACALECGLASYCYSIAAHDVPYIQHAYYSHASVRY
jgi:hypothetical protein